jgi:hypothetical protein
MIWGLLWARKGDAFVLPFPRGVPKGAKLLARHGLPTHEAAMNALHEQSLRVHFLQKVFPDLGIVTDFEKWSTQGVHPLLMPHADFEGMEKRLERPLLVAKLHPMAKEVTGWAFALGGDKRNPREITRRLPEGILHGLTPGGQDGEEVDGARSLDDLWWQMSSVKAYVGVDSGPAHLAVALGKPAGVLMPSTNADPRWSVSLKEKEQSNLPSASGGKYTALVYGTPDAFQEARLLARRFIEKALEVAS